MLKKMRWRFIGAAMAAFLAVVLALLCTINLWNYQINTRQQDATLKLLVELDQRFPTGNLNISGSFFDSSVEMRYMTRFFSAHCDEDGNVFHVNMQYIASISSRQAAEYAQHVLSGRSRSGYYRGFRYRVADSEWGSTVVFLNAERELQSMRSLLLVSGMVALASSLAAFILVVLFSNRAIAPYIRNIEAQKRFITDASHELKTPLTAISTSADILAMDLEENEWVQNIQQQSARLARLVANLVTLSRLDEERPFPEAADFSLSEAVWEISEPMASLAGAKGKQYTQQIKEGIVLHGDRSAVQQVVSILLDNAIKYSDEGGRIHLEVSRQKRPQIRVYNTCTLSDPKEINRLFDRFYRPDESRSKKTGGTGLGLSIAKATVEAHGGKISVSSNGGRDITFTVVL